MRRGMFSDKERNVFMKVEAEHELFKYKMLASPVNDVYERCNEIRFYECVYEYFQYCTNIKEDYIDACLKEHDILAALWRTYIENEYLKFETWEDIEDLILLLMKLQREKALPLNESDD